MKMDLRILLLFLLAGCFDQVPPSAPPPPPPHDEMVDLFNLEELLKKPLEDLPKEMPEDSDYFLWSSVNSIPVSKNNMVGTWFGGAYRGPLGINENVRVYLQFSNDGKFSYICLSKEKPEYSVLIKGEYSIKDTRLYLEVKPEPGLSEPKGLQMLLVECGDFGWRNNLTLKVPIWQSDASTLILSTTGMQRAKNYLVKK